jgi:MFS family permease
MDHHRPARLHYAWVILAVTCLTVVLTAGVTAVPAVLIHPLEVAFGWDRATIALAVSINVFLYGLAGPFAGRLMLRIGPRRVMLLSLLLIAAGVAASTQIQTVFQLYLLWGVVVGVGTGSTALVLSATVVNRWFTTQRGLALGLLGAASSTGRLVFLPLLALVVTALGWQAVGWVVAGCLLVIAVPLVALLMRDTPAALRLAPYGTGHAAASGNPTTAPAPEAPLVPLSAALRQGDFWRLWLTFAICGATTNGLIGTHLIPHALDQGLSAVAAATTLAMMGILDIVGTLGSGWLSDRYDKRVLLAAYYGLRGLSLLYLPYADDLTTLALFGVVYGLDWIATVPPTVGLATDLFGPRSGPILFGWIFFGHQVGAALAAYGGGLLRVWFGTYQMAFTTAGLLALGAALLVLTIRQGRRPVRMASTHQMSPAGAPGAVAATYSPPRAR